MWVLGIPITDIQIYCYYGRDKNDQKVDCYSARKLQYLSLSKMEHYSFFLQYNK